MVGGNLLEEVLSALGHRFTIGATPSTRPWMAEDGTKGSAQLRESVETERLSPTTNQCSGGTGAGVVHWGVAPGRVGAFGGP